MGGLVASLAVTIGAESIPAFDVATVKRSREQLGLRLDVRRALVDVIVIDRLSLTPTPD